MLWCVSASPETASVFRTDAGKVRSAMTVVSGNFLNDVMAAWQFRLVIVPDAGATGNLTFQDEATGTPPNPPNYILGNHGLGIVANNASTQLDADDFDSNGGTAVPGPRG